MPTRVGEEGKKIGRLLTQHCNLHRSWLSVAMRPALIPLMVPHISATLLERATCVTFVLEEPEDAEKCYAVFSSRGKEIKHGL